MNELEGFRRLVQRWRDMVTLSKALPSGATNQAAFEVLTRCADQVEALINETNDTEKDLTQ